jgi:elongation factor Ts
MEKIKELREKTGAGMVDCKKALDEAGGDLDKAVEILRKKGISKAAKRTEREASEGVVLVGVNEAGNEGYIVEMNSESDFVARNEKFQELGKMIFEAIKAHKPASLEMLLELSLSNGSIKDHFDNLSGVIGEKLVLKRFEIVSGVSVGSYSHLGGKIGVLVALDRPDSSALAVDIAMQIAAANPKYLEPSQVSAEEISKEKDIYREQLIKEGKPEAMIEKISEGKLGKFFSEICLIKQEYIKDDKQTVEQVLGGAKVIKFVRYSL